ncbi:unnamed protein product [Phytophthora lilii]|uniref:Unnamed protein product n=1 Tax=Phytophthora lilii TaxID=2077276 RepID=A0A9W6TIY7_9STRA|nr:unnamed protein product [Phytophthora lilii]
MTPTLAGDDDFRVDEASLLKFLAECDMANEIITLPTNSGTSEWAGGDELNSANASTSRGNQVATKRKTWRELRKEEILILRRQAKELSRVLERLKTTSGTSLAAPNTIAGSNENVMESQLNAQPALNVKSVSLWEGIAERQSRLRQSSVEENANLRKQLRRYMQVASWLQRMINRKLPMDMKHSTMNEAQRCEYTLRSANLPLNNKAAFNELIEGIDEKYLELDMFFQRVGMHDLSCPGQRSEILRNGTTGLLVEFQDNHAVPFDLSQTEEAVWKPDGNASKDPTLIFFRVSVIQNRASLLD